MEYKENKAEEKLELEHSADEHEQLSCQVRMIVGYI